MRLASVSLFLIVCLVREFRLFEKRTCEKTEATVLKTLCARRVRAEAKNFVLYGLYISFPNEAVDDVTDSVLSGSKPIPKTEYFEMGECNMKTRKKSSGFTLVEILIVVVILGILAAIVIPQFTQASTEAREASLRSNLQSVRSQIQLYKIQHNDFAPTSAALFLAEMTGRTDQDRTVNPVGLLGPYLQSIPVNPFTTASAIDADGSGDDWTYAVDAQGDPSFTASDDGVAADGTAHTAF